MRKFTRQFTQRLTQFQTDRSYYHVVLSGNRRMALFSTVDDRRAINAIASDALQRFDATLHAYCLMPNHFRALVHIDDRSLIKMLRRIATRYSQHRQAKLNAAQHLFERPYTAQRIDTDGDFLNLLRCIHLSPVFANKVVGPADYLWSSHRAYLGYKSVAQITTDFGLSLLAANSAQARVAYQQFIAAGVAEDFEHAMDRKAKNPNDAPSSVKATTLEKSSIIQSRNRLPVTGTLTLPRFARKKHVQPRRFLSVH